MADKYETISKCPTDMKPDSPPINQVELKVVGKGTSRTSLRRTLTEDGLSVRGSGSGSRSGSRGSAEDMVAPRGNPSKNNELMPYLRLPIFRAPYIFQVSWPTKRRRVWPRSARRMQGLASPGGFAAGLASNTDFVPHVLTIGSGEDVVGKIFSFSSETDSRAICILSATGLVSSAKLCQPCTPNATLTYEGFFEIITLCGSLAFDKMKGRAPRRNGTLSVSLANPDGRVFGGNVAGPLIALTPIQLVFGSYKQVGKKDSMVRNSAIPSVPMNAPNDSALAAVPISIRRPSIDDELSRPPTATNFNPFADRGKGVSL